MTNSFTQDRVHRILNKIEADNLYVRRVADLANFTPSTIQDILKPNWNPNLKTLLPFECALFGSKRTT